MESPFVTVIRKLLSHRYVQKLQFFSSHRVKPPTQTNNRLKHSIRIAFFAYRLSKLFFQDPKYCTRAGLLHDIGYATVTPEFARDHSFDHALAGIQLLKRTNEPTIILDATRTHMFPIGPFPKSVFSFVIWLADKLDWIIYLTKLIRFFDRYIARILGMNSLCGKEIE